MTTIKIDLRTLKKNPNAGNTYTGYIWKTYYYYLIGKDLGWGKPVNKRFYLSGY